MSCTFFFFGEIPFRSLKLSKNYLSKKKKNFPRININFVFKKFIHVKEKIKIKIKKKKKPKRAPSLEYDDNNDLKKQTCSQLSNCS